MRLASSFALAALLVLPALPSASAFTLAQPRWQPGDEWTFQISLVENGATVQTGERHVVVTQRGSFGGRDALWFTTFLNMSGDPSSSYTEIRDASTGALLATQSGNDTMTAVQPCHEFQYPLEYPKSWTVSCDLGFGPVETYYTVAGTETLTLPAGSFETLSVDAIGNDAVRYWFAERACGKVAEFSQVNELQTHVNLTSFRCTPVAGATTTTTPPTGPSPTRTTPTGTTPPTSPPPYDYTCGGRMTQTACDVSDEDHDGVYTPDERKYGTDPNNNDTDGDWYVDGDDIQNGRDPTRPDPLISPQYDYTCRGTLPPDACRFADEDGDGVETWAEKSRGSDPHNANTDGDELDDQLDKFPIDAKKTDPGPAIALVVAMIGALALLRRRRRS